MLIDFKDEEFETKIKNEDVSIIQFSAEWCACRVKVCKPNYGKVFR